MESNINLLPTKDKELKRGAKPSQPEQLVEMTKPEDRVFQERVVRVGGVLQFFKRIFKRTPKLPKQDKTKSADVPPPPLPTFKTAHPVGKISKLETMADRLPSQIQPAATQAPGFIGKFFSHSKTNEPVKLENAGATRIVPPPPPPPAATKVQTPRKPAWGAPPPASIEKPAETVSASNVKPSVSILPPPPPPPLPYRRDAVAQQIPKKQAAPIGNGFTNAPAASAEGGVGLNVNLVPEEFQVQTSKKTLVVAGSILGIAAILVIAATLGLHFYESHLQSKSRNLDTELQALTKATREIEQVELNDAIVLQQRTADVQRVLSTHIYWDKFFKELEAVTLPSVTYQNLTVDINGSVSMSATTTSFDDVGKQLLAYQQASEFIKSSTILSASKSEQQVSSTAPPGQEPATRTIVNFSISLRVDPSIFLRK